MNKRLVVALACVLLVVLTACAGPGAYVKSTGGDWVQEVNLTANGYYVIYFKDNPGFGFCTRDESIISEAKKARDGVVIIAGAESSQKIAGGVFVFYRFSYKPLGDQNGALANECPVRVGGRDIVYLQSVERFDPGDGMVTSIFEGFSEQLSHKGTKSFFVP